MQRLPTWATLAIGAVAGIAATMLVQLFYGRAKVPDGTGTVVTSTIAAISAIFAWSGFTRWETRHLKEKRAAIAADALVTAFSVHDTLIHINTVALGIAESRTPEEAYEPLLGKISDGVELRKQLSDVRARTAVYFTDELEELLSDLAGMELVVRYTLVAIRHEPGSYTAATPDGDARRKAIADQKELVALLWAKIRKGFEPYVLVDSRAVRRRAQGASQTPEVDLGSRKSPEC